MNTQPPRRSSCTHDLVSVVGCWLGLPAVLLFFYFAYKLIEALGEGIAALQQ